MNILAVPSFFKPTNLGSINSYPLFWNEAIMTMIGRSPGQSGIFSKQGEWWCGPDWTWEWTWLDLAPLLSQPGWSCLDLDSPSQGYVSPHGSANGGGPGWTWHEPGPWTWLDLAHPTESGPHHHPLYIFILSVNNHHSVMWILY